MVGQKNCFSCGNTDNIHYSDKLNEWYCGNCKEGIIAIKQKSFQKELRDCESDRG